MNESLNAAIPAARENILGIRIVAGIIDAIVLAVIFFLVSVLFGESDASLSGLAFILYVIVSFGYYFFLENARGQTLGKMVMKIKVVSTEGPLTPGKVAVRTILRIVDGLFLYLVGVVVIALSKDQQRIGDMAAGTTVVRAEGDARSDSGRGRAVWQ
jgi:uncharacterized RDD family membrane protein YckC